MGLEVLRGRAWVFGDDVDTDQMAPWSTMGKPWEERRPTVLQTRPGWVEEVRPGDVVVAGRNWGCGSSRETAPENLQRLGVAAVVAESFGRIYFRNAVALAFPHLVCPGITAACQEGDELEVDVAGARVVDRTRDVALAAEPYDPAMLEILSAGGLLEVLKARLAT